jgi:hypothetical protein
LNTAFSQVTIRERVEIKPGSAQNDSGKFVSLSATRPTVTLKMQYISCQDWTNPGAPPPTVRFDQPCGASSTQTGPVSQTINYSEIYTISSTFTVYEPGGYSLTVIYPPPQGSGAQCGGGYANYSAYTFLAVNDNLGYSRIDRPVVAGAAIGYLYTGSCLASSVAPESIYVGETSQILPQMKTADGTIINYPSGQLFNVNIVEGEQYGTLISPTGQNGPVLSNVPEGFYFMATSTNGDADAFAKIHVEEVTGTALSKQVQKSEDGIMSVSSCESLCDDKKIVIKPCDFQECSNQTEYDASYSIDGNGDNNSECGDPHRGTTYFTSPSSNQHLLPVINVGVCNNSASGCISFNITSVNVKFVSGVCKSVLEDMWGQKAINSDDDISSCNEAYEVISYFNELVKNLRKGGGALKGDKYYNYESILAHEFQHLPHQDVILRQAIEDANKMLKNKYCLSAQEVSCNEENILKKLNGKKMDDYIVTRASEINNNRIAEDEAISNNAEADYLEQTLIPILEERWPNWKSCK